jgi:hypothetical protein
MIDMLELRQVLLLHERTFALLRWVGSQLQRGSLDLSHVHTNMGIGEAAEDWIRRNLGNLPGEVRPSQDELAPFARLFASYLRTSFEIGEKRMSSSCGCYCSFCAYVSNAPYLKARALSKRAYATAKELKRIYLQELARDIGVNASQSRLDELTSAESSLSRDLSIAAYAKELIRRTEFVTQGEGVYALWREFAWVNGHPDRRFKLTLNAVEQSQNIIIAALRDRLA